MINIIADGKILSALITGGSIRKAAEIIRCSPTTIRKRLEKPNFRSEYEKMKSEMLTEASAELCARLSDSAAVLAEIMTDDSATPGMRIQAADAILRDAIRYYSLSEIERRITALEAIQNNEEYV